MKICENEVDFWFAVILLVLVSFWLYTFSHWASLILGKCTSQNWYNFRKMMKNLVEEIRNCLTKEPLHLDYQNSMVSFLVPNNVMNCFLIDERWWFLPKMPRECLKPTENVRLYFMPFNKIKTSSSLFIGQLSDSNIFCVCPSSFSHCDSCDVL